MHQAPLAAGECFQVIVESKKHSGATNLHSSIAKALPEHHQEGRQS
jgi:hypothetical protein